MCQSCGGAASSSALLNSLANAADTNTATSAKLIKKVMASEEDMVATLLPTPPSSHNGRLNIGA